MPAAALAAAAVAWFCTLVIEQQCGCRWQTFVYSRLHARLLSDPCPALCAVEPEPEEAVEVESASSADVSRQGSTADFASLEEEAVAG